MLKHLSDFKLAQKRVNYYKKDLAFLLKSATGFSELLPEDDIYQFIGERLKELLKDSFFIISSFNHITHTFHLKKIIGLEDKFDTVVELLGENPLGKEFKVSEEGKLSLNTGKLHRVLRGLYGLSFGRIKEEICHKIEEKLNIGEIYTIGFIRHAKLFGSISIFMQKGVKLKKHNTVEIFVNEASIALQRKYAEEELKKNREHLEEIVSKRTEELKKIALELQDANQLKEFFIDVIRHDLLNFTSVILNSSMCLIDEETVDDKREYLELIRDASLKSIEILENISKYYKLKNIENIDCEPLDLNHILKDSMMAFKYELEDKNISIDYHTKNECIIPVNIMMGEVFSNLISNAIKYGFNDSKIIVDVEEKKDRFIISVKNYGEIIKDKDKEKIFKRFERLGKNEVEGKGIGLAIARQIVELHGGEIWVEDNPEGGSIFFVSLLKSGN